MKRVIRIALMSLVALAVIVPAHAASKVTVGDFLTQIAQVRNLPATDGASAAAALRGSGVNVPAVDLTATLTEGHVAQIAGAMGLNVTTANPQAPFNQSQVNGFVSSFGSDIAKIGSGSNSPQTPTGSHKSKKKPKSKKKSKKSKKSKHEPV